MSVADPCGGCFRGRPQPDHVRSGAQGIPVRRPAEYAATGGQDDRFEQFEGPFEAGLFGVAEALFSDTGSTP